MRDIIDDERQRLGSQGLAAQRVAAARRRQLRCDSVGMNHITALFAPRFRSRDQQLETRPCDRSHPYEPCAPHAGPERSFQPANVVP